MLNLSITWVLAFAMCYKRFGLLLLLLLSFFISFQRAINLKLSWANVNRWTKGYLDANTLSKSIFWDFDQTNQGLKNRKGREKGTRRRERGWMGKFIFFSVYLNIQNILPKFIISFTTIQLRKIFPILVEFSN